VRGILRAEFLLLMYMLYYVLALRNSKKVQSSVIRIKQYSGESVISKSTYKTHGSIRIIEKFTTTTLQIGYWRQLKGEPDNVKPTLLMNTYTAAEDGSRSATQLEREATLYIVTGTQTTALTATIAVWMVAC
jgi:hypothetical protein